MINRVVWRSLLLLAGLALLLQYAACSVGVVLCQSGRECEFKERCIEDRCQPAPSAEGNRPPISRAGQGLRVRKGGVVRLNGSTSTDADFDRLRYLWSFVKKPKASKAVITNAENAMASFIADVSGTFEVKLTVRDGFDAVDEDQISIRVNHAPITNAGGDQLVMPGTRVPLQGDRSADIDIEDTLSYQWRLLQKPSDSRATIQQADKVQAFLNADVPGRYFVELQVSDGMNSTTDTMEVQVVNPTEISPELSQISPNAAPTKSIAKIRLLGKNFVRGGQVLFNQGPIPALYRSLKEIEILLDLNEVKIGRYEILVKNPGGKQTRALTFQVQDVPIPVIVGVNPAALTAGEERKVTISGRGFVSSAKIRWNDQIVASRYIDNQRIEATLPTRTLKAGSYALVVVNDEKRVSAPFAIKVATLPPKPVILSYTLSEGGPQINKEYNFLRLNARGLLTSTQVLVDGKLYKGKTKAIFSNNGNGSGFLELLKFSSQGFSAGLHTFVLRNVTPGYVVESNTYQVRFYDGDIPNVSSIRFYDANSTRTYAGATDYDYRYVEIYGSNFADSLRVEINDKAYKGRVRRIDSRRIQLMNFSTKGFSVGSHSYRVVNIVKGRNVRGTRRNFTLVDGKVPLIRSVQTSEGGTIFTGRDYTFLRIYGQYFRQGLQIVLDGVPYKKPLHIEGNNLLYVYQFSTKTIRPGAHTLIVRNRVGGKDYNSRLFTFNVQDGESPRIRSVRFLPTSTLYIGETYQANLNVDNVKSGAELLVDGVSYKGSIQLSQTLIAVPQFDTSGFRQGSHTFRVRNVVNGKPHDSNIYTFYVRPRPRPQLRSLTPSVIQQQASPMLLSISGANFSPSSTVYIGSEKYKATLSGASYFRLTLDPKKLKVGRLDVKVVAKDGQASNTLPLEIVPNVAPLLWRVTPHEFHLSGDPTAGTSAANISLQGYLIQNRAVLLVDGKVVGTVTSISGNYVRAQLSMQTFTKAGTYALQVRNPDGRLSNLTDIWVYGSTKPEIYNVAPNRLYRSTRNISLYLYGRGLSAKSQVLLNGKPYNAVFQASPTSGTFYSDRLLITLTPQDVQGLTDLIKVQVKRADGTLSNRFQIIKDQSTSGGPVGLFGASPSTIYAQDNRTLTFRLYGRYFTHNSKAYLNGVPLFTTYQSSSRLSVVLQGPSAFTPGTYLHFEVRDGARVSSHVPLYVTRSLTVTQVAPAFLRKSDPVAQLKLTFPFLPQGTTLEIFGKSLALFGTSQATIGLAKELADVKPGMYTLYLQEPTTKERSQRVGIHVLP